MVNGQIYHFGAIGLSNGLSILADRETRTHWDHITGEAVDGQHTGLQLEVWPIRMTTVAAVLDEQMDIKISLSEYRSLKRMLAQRLYPSFIHKKVRLPWFFHSSMSSHVDPRLDKMTQGLGLIVGRQTKYYPMNSIPPFGLDDAWLGRILRIELGQIDGVPHASWSDSGDAPMQLLTRWYGFSFTYPQCEIYRPQHE